MLKIKVIICLVLLSYSNAFGEKLRVGISQFSPFVTIEDNRVYGYSIDLWREIAEQMNVDYEFVISKNVSQKLENLNSGNTDTVIGGVTITSQREEEFDFCFSDCEGGLGLLTLKKNVSFFSSIIYFFRMKAKTILMYLLFLLIVSHLIWLSEKGGEVNNTAFDERYWPGIFDAMYWTIVTAATVGYGDKVAQRFMGRLVTMFLILTLIPTFTWFITQFIDLGNEEININEYLNQKHSIGIISNTSSQKFLSKYSLIDTVGYDNISLACQSLEKKEVDSVVYDYINLRDDVRYNHNLQLHKEFNIQKYGIVVRHNSKLRKKINFILLRLKESGELDRLKSLYF